MLPAWQSGTGLATSDRARSFSRKVPRPCRMPSCSPSCCAPAPRALGHRSRARALATFGSLRKLMSADRRRFCAVAGLGPARFAELQAAIEIGRRRAAESMKAGPPLGSPRATCDFLSSKLRDLEHEVFCCIYLDKRHRMIEFQELFRGTIDGASVHPREIVKLALQRNSAAVIVAHNHPPGSPSRARPMNSSRSGSRRPSPSWTSGCSTTSSSATA